MTEELEIFHQKAITALSKGEFEQAHQYLMAILTQNKYFADGYFLMAMIASAHNNVKKAIQLIEQAIKLDGKCSEYFAQLAKHYALIGEHALANHAAERASGMEIRDALTFDTLAVAYSKIGLHNKAIPLFKQAVALADDNYQFYYNLALSQTFTGDFAGAKASHKKVIQLNPNHYKSYGAMSTLSKPAPNNNNIAQLSEIYAGLKDPEDKLSIAHALAREHEALSQYEQAFNILHDAKHSKLAAIDYDIKQDLAMFDSLQQFFGTNQQQTLTPGNPSCEPHFIVGMPRTGTTLVERILSGHSDITSAGELGYFGSLLKELGHSQTNKMLDAETIAATQAIDFNFLATSYLDKTRHLVKGNAKFIDKMPLNVLYVGFIIQAFPQCKILCLDRNPLDTIVSNYRQYFSANSDSYNYAYDLSTTAIYYAEFRRLVSLWAAMFPKNFYQVNYEQLVNNPETEAKKLIEFCQLDWQKQCLQIDKNTSPVATASATQVRTTINNLSVGNWQKYQPFLVEVKKALSSQGIDWCG